MIHVQGSLARQSTNYKVPTDIFVGVIGMVSYKGFSEVCCDGLEGSTSQ